MAKQKPEPQILEEPDVSPEMSTGTATGENDDNPWIRGLWMLILGLLFGVGQTILLVCAVIQFIWIVIQKETNQPIADFGVELGEWLAKAARFLTATSDDRPFPFEPWGGA